MPDAWKQQYKGNYDIEMKPRVLNRAVGIVMQQTNWTNDGRKRKAMRILIMDDLTGLD